MRVSEFQIFGMFLNHLQRSRSRLLATQEQIASGKRVMRPSDDPIAYGRIVVDQAALAFADQRIRNIEGGLMKLRQADSTLGSATNVLVRLKELAVQLRDDVNNPDNRKTGAREALQLFRELQQLANTQVSGQALFTGTSTHGRATGVAISTPLTLTDGSADTVRVSVDGVASGTIDLVSATGSYTGPDLAALLQSKINADPALAAAGRSVTVSYDTDHLVIASNSAGRSSTVEVTGGSALAVLGFAGGSRTTGDGPFALYAEASADAGNTGGGLLAQAVVQDPAAVTLDNYLIKFTSSSTFDVYNIASPLAVSANSANTGGAAVSERGVSDPRLVRRDDYEIRLQSLFTVTSANNAVRFDPGSGPPVTISIAPGRYTGSQLASALKAALDAGSGGDTYTVTFSDSTGKFTITNNAGNAGALQLLFDDPATTAETLLGFPASAASVSVGASVTGEDTASTSGATLMHSVQDVSAGSAMFTVSASNNTLYLNGSPVTLRAGSYTGTELAAELQARLGSGFTVAYTTGTGRPARSFTITNATGAAVTFNWSNAGATAAGLLGFDAADTTVANGASDASDYDAGLTAYSSGGAIEFDGLRVVLRDASGSARNGDVYTVSQSAPVVLSNQRYVSGAAIDIQGVRVVIRDGGSAPAAGDLYRIITGVQYQGDAGLHMIEVQDQQTVAVNMPGSRAFSGPTVDVFRAVKILVSALAGDDGGGIERAMADLDDAIAQLSNAQGEIGAMTTRLDSTKSHLELTKQLVSEALAQSQDADIVKLISELTLQQYALQATAQASARVFETSLMNFLR